MTREVLSGDFGRLLRASGERDGEEEKRQAVGNEPGDHEPHNRGREPKRAA